METQKSLVVIGDIVEEIDAIAVETVYVAQQTLLEGKLKIGEIVATYAGTNVTALVQQLGKQSKLSERELFYCYQYFTKQNELEKLPDYQSKAISWNKVKKLMSGGLQKKTCQHEHTKTITICEDCGSRVQHA